MNADTLVPLLTGLGGSYEITVACLSVCLSVRPSLCPSVRQFGVFFRNGSLFSSDLLHDCRQLEY